MEAGTANHQKRTARSTYRGHQGEGVEFILSVPDISYQRRLLLPDRPAIRLLRLIASARKTSASALRRHALHGSASPGAHPEHGFLDSLNRPGVAVDTNSRSA